MHGQGGFLASALIGPLFWVSLTRRSPLVPWPSQSSLDPASGQSAFSQEQRFDNFLHAIQILCMIDAVLLCKNMTKMAVNLEIVVLTVFFGRSRYPPQPSNQRFSVAEARWLVAWVEVITIES